MAEFGSYRPTISQSKAKFDARADGDVRLAVRRPKPHKNPEKTNFVSENFAEKIFLALKNFLLGIFRNAFSQIFAPIRAKFETKMARGRKKRFSRTIWDPAADGTLQPSLLLLLHHL